MRFSKIKIEEVRIKGIGVDALKTLTAPEITEKEAAVVTDNPAEIKALMELNAEIICDEMDSFLATMCVEQGFTQKTIAMVNEIAAAAEETDIYKKAKEANEKATLECGFTALEWYGYLCMKLLEAQNIAEKCVAIIFLMPNICAVLKEENTNE